MTKLNEEVLDTFGRIIYAIAKSDGEVQTEEVKFIQSIIDSHEWAKEMELSFAIETELDMDADEVFTEAMQVFKNYDIREHYPDLLDLLERIAKSHGGVVDEEQELLDRFRISLI